MIHLGSDALQLLTSSIMQSCIYNNFYKRFFGYVKQNDPKKQIPFALSRLKKWGVTGYLDESITKFSGFKITPNLTCQGRRLYLNSKISLGWMATLLSPHFPPTHTRPAGTNMAILTPVLRTSKIFFLRLHTYWKINVERLFLRVFLR